MKRHPEQKFKLQVAEGFSRPLVFDVRLLRLTIIATFILLPAVVSLFFIKLFGVNVVFMDAWPQTVSLLEKFYAGNLSLYDFFVNHNEHRLFFPRLLMFLLAMISRYNNLVEMYVGWALLSSSVWLIFMAFGKSFGVSERTLLRFVPVAWLMFSLQQHDNLLFGVQIAVFMVTLTVLSTALLLDASKGFDRYFFSSLCAGIVASFSNANGLLAWPIGLCQLWGKGQLGPQRSKEDARNLMWSWGLIGASVFIVYFIGYSENPRAPSLLYIVYEPISSIAYFFAVIGSPLAVREETAISVGILLVMLGVYAYGIRLKTCSPLRFSIWDSLILFALLSSVMIAVGRAGYGVGQALSSRYTTFIIPGIVGLYVKFLEALPERGKIHLLLTGILLYLILQGLYVSLASGAITGEGARLDRNKSAYVLRTFRFQGDDMLSHFLTKFPDAQTVRRWAHILEERKMNVFADDNEMPNRRVADSTDFVVESLNGKPPTPRLSIDLRRNGTLAVSGWAIDKQSQREAGGVYLVVDRQLTIPAQFGLDRTDVATYFGKPQYRFSGFVAWFAASALGKGDHTLSLRILTADKRGYYEPAYQAIIEVE